MNAFFISAVQQYGYLALWLIVFVAAAGAPISGSLLIFAAGAFAAFGDLNIIILFPVALSAAVMGDNLTYFIGRRVGIPLLAWLERQKRFRWISPKALESARSYFRRRTSIAIFLTRFLIVALGGPINLLAGLEQYPYPNFLFWDVSGQILGAIIPLGLGYIFAASWEEAAGLFGAFSSFFLALLTALVLCLVLVRMIRQRRRARTAEAEAKDMLPQLKIKVEQDTGPLPISMLPQLESKVRQDTGPLPISD